ncbi:MAG: 50S ribosomal protein L15 [Candidatus Adiutrix intracellularis]|jgi:large subunit ribosomal protein L15|nr:MAG: 50S ribosomal protein L15 [Candidatus Adiutrix intracellularis]MDR2826688.1 50S ribosomal protein L15 [Candidatus Adiutrix intracellularis]
MDLNSLSPPAGSRKKPKRVGRGESSGWGKTAGRGHKGQKARSGGGAAPGFEGGQMPLQRRLPKRGFTNIFKKTYALVNLDALEAFAAGSVIDAQILAAAGLIRHNKLSVKLLAKGVIDKPLVIKVQAASEKAAELVRAAGGTVEINVL